MTQALETYLINHEPDSLESLRQAEESWGPSDFSIDFTIEEANEFLSFAGRYLERDDVGVYGQSRLAITAGAVLEGLSAEVTSSALSALARGVSSYLPRAIFQAGRLLNAFDPEGEEGVDPYENYAQDPPSARALVGLKYGVLCGMTVLCRDVDARIEFRSSEPELREFLETHAWNIPNGSYLKMLLDCTDRMSLMVLDLETKRGWEVHVEGVRNGFHFFALVQHQLSTLESPPTTYKYPTEMVELIYARSWNQPMESDQAWWNYVTSASLNENGEMEENLMMTVWGEPGLGWLPRVNDTPVVLLSPLTFSRSWSNNFVAGLHPAHRVICEIKREIESDEFAKWIGDIIAANASRQEIDE